jgi:hypothetical protein
MLKNCANLEIIHGQNEPLWLGKALQTRESSFRISYFCVYQNSNEVTSVGIKRVVLQVKVILKYC